MAFGDTDKDQALKDAWVRYCDELKGCADDLFRDGFKVTSPDQRAEAFRYMAQSVYQGLVWHIENEQMAHHPWLHQCFNPLMKQAGDKSMAKEYGAYLQPGGEYRIRGERGTSRWIVLTALRQADPADPMSTAQRWQEPWALVLDTEPLLGKDVVIEPDGSFEIICSRERPADAKNWIRLTDRTNHIRLRQLFSDWDNEIPMKVWIERIGAEPGTVPPPLFNADQITFGLAKAAHFVRKTTSAWGPPPAESRVDNQMNNMPVPPTRIGGIDGNPGGIMGICWWSLQPDEALILEFKPIPSLMWSIELENAWWCTPDYRWRLVATTDSQAVLEDDGTCRLVVANRDPGVPNWLDTGTWPEGWVRYRGTLSEGMRGPEWTSRVVKLNDLANALPKNAKRIDAPARKKQIADRAASLHKRWP
jgi:hypothetical protein